ncbi:MAG: hypothetical protein IKR66_06075 [Bacteroidales bacterium]|nr:hypothetical protein [Bacteroidales bacterium]
MAQEELSITEIENRKNEVRSVISQRVSNAISANKEIRIDIEVLNETIGSGFQSRDTIMVTNGADESGIMSSYDNTIASILSNPNNIAIQIIIKKITGQPLKNSKWMIITKRATTPTNIIIQQERYEETTEHPVQQQPQPQPQQQQEQSQNSMNMAGMNDVFKLMGFDVNTSLEGFENKNMGLFGTIMAVRENNIREEFKREKEKERYDNLLVEKTKLESELEGVKKELADEQAYSEKLEDEIDELNEQIEELEKLKPEHSFAGISLVGVGTKIVENIARKHASFVGSLAGMNGEDFKKMLDNDDNQAIQQPVATPVTDVEVEPVADDERSQKIAEVGKFLKTLSDEDFERIWQLMGAFHNDNSLIQKIELLQQ